MSGLYGYSTVRFLVAALARIYGTDLLANGRRRMTYLLSVSFHISPGVPSRAPSPCVSTATRPLSRAPGRNFLLEAKPSRRLPCLVVHAQYPLGTPSHIVDL